jgi:hypothetical protein
MHGVQVVEVEVLQAPSQQQLQQGKGVQMQATAVAQQQQQRCCQLWGVLVVMAGPWCCRLLLILKSS